MKPPLTPFADELPVPRRLMASAQGGWLTIPIRAATHRFHRDLPELTPELMLFMA